MAEKKLSELDSTSTVQSTDLVEIAQDQGGGTYVSKKVQFSNFSPPATTTITFTIGDGINPVVVGTRGYTGSIPFDATIKSWRIFEASSTPLSGSIIVDIWKSTTGTYPPTVSDTIAGSEKPTLSSQTNNSDTDLTTWATGIDAGDVIGFNIDSNDGCKKVVLILEVEK